jgi:predicted  nucleic acid-binding Zn-ribbon protein
MRHLKFYLLVAVQLLITAQVATAVDYDYETARARWQAAQREADDAQYVVDSETARLASAQRDLDQAAYQEQVLTNQLQSLRASIRRIDDQIADQQSSRRQLLNERENLQIRVSNLTTEIQDLDNAISALGNEIRSFDREIDRLTREINRLAGQDPDHPDLPNLRRELDSTQREQNRLVNEQQNMQNQRNNRINQRQGHYSRITAINATISSIDRYVDSLQADRRRLVADEQDTEISLNQARYAVADARAYRDRVQLDVDRAVATYQAANNRAQSAKRYYDEVLANYNAAMDSAVALGTGNARRDSGREAGERSQPVATSDGQASAQTRGTEQGAREAKLISEVQGYNHGLANGASDSQLRQPYSDGLVAGKAHAASKAQAENFPQGYNAEMNGRLARSPSMAATIDITDSISQQPGDAGAALLDPRAMPIGNVSDPSYTAKQEPAFAPPTAQPGSPSVPAPDRRYYRVECGIQPLPVFDQACRSAYDRTYNNDFAALYRSAYIQTYRTAFGAAVTAPYTAARQVRSQDIYNIAAAAGAKDRGILNGFSGEIANARRVAEQNGRLAFVNYLGTGFLPILRSIAVVENYDDGNLSPGEQFKLKIVIDNYGLKSSPLKKVRLNITSAAGGTFAVAVRELPALAADTTTTLEGVLTGSIGGSTGQLNLNATLELEQSDGSWLTLDEATFSDGIRLPLELTAVRFPQALPVGTPGSAQFVFRNNTNRAIESTDVVVSTNQEVVALSDGQLNLPEIAVGESVELPVALTATALAGGNQLHDFAVNTGSIAGTTNLTFKKPVVIPLSRNANLDLCLPACTTPYQVPLRVRAGGSLLLPAQFTFLSTQRQQGPFEMGKLQTSDSRIGATNGSTLRASLGSWSPGSSPYRATFGYTFPAVLKGQTHWVSLYIKEGSRQIHVVKVPVVVE